VTDDRTPPHDADAEQAVLGACLLTGQAIDDCLDRGVRGDDFYRPAHETIWRTVVDLHGRREPVDPITVAAALDRAGDLARVGGAAYLHTLQASTPTAATAGWYARIVRDKAILRGLTAAGATIAQLGYSADGGDVTAAVGAAQGAVQAVADSLHGDTPTTFDDIATATFDQIEAGIRCTPTPWRDLNYLIDGWAPGCLYAIGARPGVGKTWLSLAAFTGYAKAGGGLGAAYFTFEMTAPRLYARMLAAETGVNGKRMRQGSLTDEEWGRLSVADGTLRKLPMTVEGCSGWTAQRVASRARSLHRQSRLGLVVVDHIGLVAADTRRDTRQMELSDAADVFLGLAHDLDAAVLLCTQLNRGVTQRADQRPVPSDIRDTDRIEQNCDVVMLLHRAKDSPDGAGVLEVAVSKNRDGVEGSLKLGFRGGQLLG
jgi:replicative DNA helicase